MSLTHFFRLFDFAHPSGQAIASKVSINAVLVNLNQAKRAGSPVLDQLMLAQNHLFVGNEIRKFDACRISYADTREVRFLGKPSPQL